MYSFDHVSVSFLWAKKSVFSFLSQVKFLNPYLSFVSLSFLPLEIFLLSVNRLLVSCYYWSLVHIMHFRNFSWRLFMAVVNILKCSMVITKIVYHVLLVPGCRLVPPAVSGQRRSGFLQIKDALTLQENQSLESRNRTRRDKWLIQMHLKTTPWLSLDGSTTPTPHSYTAGGINHRSTRHRATRHGQLGTCQTSHWSSDFKYQAPVTSHRSSSHQSFRSEHQAPGTSHQALDI